MNNFYETARDEVLKAFDWGFANTYKDLTLSTEESPNPKFDCVYDVPNDCIAVRAVIDTVKGEEKKFEVYSVSSGDKSILCQTESARLRYTRRVEKEHLFDPEFTLALSFYLAALTAETITGQYQKAQSCLQKYEWKLNKAKVLNASENAPEDEDNSQYYDVR